MVQPEQLEEMVRNMALAGDEGWSTGYYLLDYRMKLVLPRIAGPSVLELGCAEGGMTRQLVHLFDEVVSLDGSPSLIEKAKKEIPSDKLTLVCSMIEDFDPGKTFPSILLACILEHVDDSVQILSLAREWLAPGGTLHITVPNAHALNRRVGKAMGMMDELDQLHDRDVRQGHQRVYTRETLEADVRAAGLVPTHWSGNFLKPLSDAQMKDWSPEVMEAFSKVGEDIPEWCAEIYLECQVASS